jgi:hypothetical protein
MSDFDYANFIESMPILFSTSIQKATMCSFLWNKQDPVTIIYNMRLYDIVRRLYFVKTGNEPTDEEIIHLMNVVRQEKAIMDFFMVYIRSGTFPDNDIVKSIHE